jgi:hypothetical protein
MAKITEDLTDWPFERVDAIKCDNGARGCALSHIKAIKLAKERGVPWVLILEDDCLMIPDARDRFIGLLNLLWERRVEWDVYSGGVTYLREYSTADLENSLFKVKAYATQFILIHSGSYDLIINRFDEQPDIPVYDVFLYKEFRVWTSVPFLSGQRPDRSDIQNRSIDYTSLFRKAEEVLVEYKNRTTAAAAAT